MDALPRNPQVKSQQANSQAAIPPKKPSYPVVLEKSDPLLKEYFQGETERFLTDQGYQNMAELLKKFANRTIKRLKKHPAPFALPVLFLRSRAEDSAKVTRLIQELMLRHGVFAEPKRLSIDQMISWEGNEIWEKPLVLRVPDLRLGNCYDGSNKELFSQLKFKFSKQSKAFDQLFSFASYQRTLKLTPAKEAKMITESALNDQEPRVHFLFSREGSQQSYSVLQVDFLKAECAQALTSGSKKTSQKDNSIWIEMGNTDQKAFSIAIAFSVYNTYRTSDRIPLENLAQVKGLLETWDAQESLLTLQAFLERQLLQESLAELCQSLSFFHRSCWETFSLFTAQLIINRVDEKLPAADLAAIMAVATKMQHSQLLEICALSALCSFSKERKKAFLKGISAKNYALLQTIAQKPGFYPLQKWLDRFAFILDLKKDAQESFKNPEVLAAIKEKAFKDKMAELQDCYEHFIYDSAIDTYLRENQRAVEAKAIDRLLQQNVSAWRQKAKEKFQTSDEEYLSLLERKQRERKIQEEEEKERLADLNKEGFHIISKLGPLHLEDDYSPSSCQ